MNGKIKGNLSQIYAHTHVQHARARVLIIYLSIFTFTPVLPCTGCFKMNK